jgi:hypothetical protein
MLNLWQKNYLDKNLTISGAWVDLPEGYNNDSGDKAQLKIASMSKDNLEAMNAIMASAKSKSEDQKSFDFNKLRIDQNELCATYLVKDWKNIPFPIKDKNGKDTGEYELREFSVESCIELLNEIEGLSGFILEEAQNKTNFRQNFTETTKKN